jgi:hypothetical protein
MVHPRKPGEVRCNTNIAPIPQGPSNRERCPNAAEFLVSNRRPEETADNQQWVCGDHVSWWARSGTVLRRAAPENPPDETSMMLMNWGPPEVAQPLRQAWLAQALADDRTMISDGNVHVPDGTTKSVEHYLHQRLAEFKRGAESPPEDQSTQ